MWLLKFYIDHMGPKGTCGVLVLLLIFFYVEAGLFGPGQNLASSELSLRQIQALMKPLGHLCLLMQLTL